MTTEPPAALLGDPASRTRLVEAVAPLVFCTDLEAPGYVLIDLGPEGTPEQFRARLVELGAALADHYLRHFGEPLRFVSVGRYDQRATTRPHRDGGPDASVLILGYEPTPVPSRVFLVDLTRAALDRGQRPGDFLNGFNPAFGGDPGPLADYTTEVRELDRGHYQALVVNNGCLPYAERRRGMLGVLHHAVLGDPRPAQPRPIASLLLGVAPAGLTPAQLDAFVSVGTGATAPAGE